MKKLIVFLLLLSSFALGKENITDVGSLKYAKLHVNKNRTPIRENYNEFAKRITHLFKCTIIFADKQTPNYYRVEFKPDKYGWVNKKYVDIQEMTPDKKTEDIQKISFKRNKKKYQVIIETQMKGIYTLVEKNNDLILSFFDNKFNPVSTQVSRIPDNFKINEEDQNELKINFYNDKKLFGYSLEPNEEGYILNIKRPPKINQKRPLKNIKIVVDPGHGGCERGACAFGLKEKDINLQISKILKKELKKRGAKVYLTRSSDERMGLYERVDFARDKNADILLSIHQNALPNPKDIYKKHGVGTYYYNHQSLPLATYIQNSLLKATGFKDDKVNLRSFALTRPTDQLSVLIECGYLIYKPEADKLTDKKFQKIIAEAIADGCEKYLKENY